MPTGWLVAGPGRREALDAARYRFAPKSPVTPIGILAAEYERFATMIDGVELELLLSPRHTAPASYFEDTEAEIDDALTGLFKDVATLGPRYPHGALRLIEVPARLRGYGGGWQMETTLALPGVLLLRERGFPTGRFYTPTVPVGGPFSTEKLDRLRMLFREDRTGADPFAGLAHNLFLHQTEACGDGAAALNYLCHALVTRLLGDDEGYFSAHVYASSPSVRTLLVGSFASAFAGGSGSVSGEVFGAVRPPSVWERALGTPFADLHALEPSQAITTSTRACLSTSAPTPCSRRMVAPGATHELGPVPPHHRPGDTGGWRSRGDVFRAATRIWALAGRLLPAGSRRRLHDSITVPVPAYGQP